MPAIYLNQPSRFLIYGCIDPRTRLIRYIGRSSSGLSHPRSYTSPCMLKDSTHRSRWIRQLLRQGLVYEVVVLEEVRDSSGLNAAERWWIAYGRLATWPLVNHTAGGDGLSGYKLTAATKAKISAANTGRTPTAEARAANARAQRGRKHSDETRRQMSQTATARQASIELREHMRRTSTGYKHTEASLRKMRKPRQKKHPPCTPETRKRRHDFAMKRGRKANGAFK